MTDHTKDALDKIDSLIRSMVTDWVDLPGAGCRVSLGFAVVDLLPLLPLGDKGWEALRAGDRLSLAETWWFAATGNNVYVATGPDAGPGIYRLLPVDQF